MERDVSAGPLGATGISRCGITIYLYLDKDYDNDKYTADINILIDWEYRNIFNFCVVSVRIFFNIVRCLCGCRLD